MIIFKKYLKLTIILTLCSFSIQSKQELCWYQQEIIDTFITEYNKLSQRKNPQRLISFIYKYYLAKTDVLTDVSRDIIYETILDHKLFDAYKKDNDEITKEGYTGKINADVLLCAQDIPGSILKVKLIKKSEIDAIVSVSLDYLKPNYITINLCKSGENWKIFDINAECYSFSLRKILLADN